MWGLDFKKNWWKFYFLMFYVFLFWVKYENKVGILDKRVV